jgi:hypothetical protein
MCVTAAALAAPVAALVRRCGTPVRVSSRDDGHHVTFLDDGATIDAIVDPDRELVRALDVRGRATQVFAVNVNGAVRTLAFGAYTSAQAGPIWWTPPTPRSGRTAPTGSTMHASSCLPSIPPRNGWRASRSANAPR